MSRNDDIQKRINKSVESARKVVEQIPPDKRKHYGLSRYEAPPSDDDEPISREWMWDVYGSARVFCPEGLNVCIPQGSTTVWLDNGDYDGLAPLPHIRTRRQLRDLLAALGYLADYQPRPPSDDDEPISNEWFKQTFGGYFIEFPDDEWREMWIYHGTPDLIELGLRDKRWQERSGGEVHYQLKHIRTRRQLRDLLAALGYRREG